MELDLPTPVSRPPSLESGCMFYPPKLPLAETGRKSLAFGRKRIRWFTLTLNYFTLNVLKRLKLITINIFLAPFALSQCEWRGRTLDLISWMFYQCAIGAKLPFKVFKIYISSIFSHNSILSCYHLSPCHAAVSTPLTILSTMELSYL